MAKKSFVNLFSVKNLDEDEFDDDLFDEDDEDEDDYEPVVKNKRSSLFSKSKSKAENLDETPSSRQTPVSRSSSVGQASYRSQSQPTYSPQPARQQPARQQQASRPASTGSKLVDFNGSKQRSESYRGKNEVYVIKPQEIGDSQVVTDFLKQGKTIIINMEGIELAPAQRIIDFIGGACYALNGSLQAISGNIFVAAPEFIEVTGDLREEILNSNSVSPELGRF